MLAVIEPGKVGVIVRLGKARDKVLEEGIHFVMPLIDRIKKYDITVQKFEVSVPAETKDLQPVAAKFVVTYRLDSKRAVQIMREHGDLENIIEELVAPQTKAAFRQAATSRNAQELIRQRAELKEDFERELGDSLGKFAITLVDIAILRMEFGEKYQEAVLRAQMAEQRAREAENMVKVANAEALAQVERAKGVAMAEEEVAKSKAKAINMVGEELTGPGGRLFMQLKAIEAWEKGGAKVPNVLVAGPDTPGLPMLFNLRDIDRDGMHDEEFTVFQKR